MFSSTMRNAALLALGVLSGCVMTHSVHVGPLRPETTPCAVAFKRLSSSQAATYEQVGAICASVTDAIIDQEGSLADEARKAVEIKACALGGQIVSPVGTCSVNRVNGTELGVYVLKAPLPETAAPGTGG